MNPNDGPRKGRGSCDWQWRDERSMLVTVAHSSGAGTAWLAPADLVFRHRYYTCAAHAKRLSAHALQRALMNGLRITRVPCARGVFSETGSLATILWQTVERLRTCRVWRRWVVHFHGLTWSNSVYQMLRSVRSVATARVETGSKTTCVARSSATAFVLLALRSACTQRWRRYRS